MLSGSAHVKAARKHVAKLTPDVYNKIYQVKDITIYNNRQNVFIFYHSFGTSLTSATNIDNKISD